jgi:UDP-3-O-acyl-N-acetylglucosamine deacetylase
MGDRTYSFDVNLLLSDNAAAYTADGYAQVGGADAVLDLGGNQGTSPTQQARLDAVAVIDVTAIDIASGNETYVLRILGCNTAGFASSVRELAAITLGKGASLIPATQADSIVGRYELMFSTEQANIKHEFIKLYVDVGGTTPSISFQAFVAVLPEP